MIVDCSSGTGEGKAAIETAAALSLDATRTITLVGSSQLITSTLTRIPCDVEMIRVVHVEKDSSPTDSFKIAREEAMRAPNQTILTAIGLEQLAALDVSDLPVVQGCRSAAAFEPVPVLRGHGDERGSFALLGDVGLAHTPDADSLLSFARLGALYADTVLQRENPKLALLSVSSRPEQLPDAHRAAHEQLQDLANLPANYLGLATPNDVFRAEADVLITDGYAGGILRGLIDSALQAGERLVERSRSGIRQRLGIRALGDVFTRLRHFADHETYGGTAILGVAPPIIALRHDASSKAWKNAMILASEWERVKLQGLIEEMFAF